MAGSSSSTVFIVDDDASMRESLCALVESVGLKAEMFESAQRFLDLYQPSWAGCLVLDVRMPGMTGPQLLEHLRERGVMIPAIVITAHGDVQSAVHSMKLGAMDFIEKPFSPAIMLERVNAALTRDAEDRARAGQNAEVKKHLEQLSPREQEVLELVIVGKASKQIAGDLNISQKTVETHRANIMQKMHVSSVAELVNLVVSARSG